VSWDASAAPQEPRLPLVELAAGQASFYRSWGTEAGDLFAQHMEALVRGLRATSAASPDVYRERIATLDGDALADLLVDAEARGHDRAMAAADCRL
jgi:hypothetical protein